MASAKARSPSYPAIGLKEAIEKAEAVYRNDYQNQVPRLVAAKHMGYESLNGKSLGVLSALLKYGLLEGRGDSTRISDLALRIIAHSHGDAERASAIREAASRPELFTELDKRYPDGKGSDAAIRSYLITQKFIPHAADSALRSYRETKELVLNECSGYKSFDKPLENDASATKFGGACVGDFIQWEIGGVLQMETPMRVRLVSDDGNWVAVEGSETGIPMEQVIVQERAPAPVIEAPRFAIDTPKPKLAESNALPEGWKEERLIDDGGEEIFIRYLGEPTPERYTYIRDYLDFKLSRMKKAN